MIQISTLFNDGWYKITINYTSRYNLTRHGLGVIVVQNLRTGKEVKRYKMCLKKNASKELDFDLVFARAFKFIDEAEKKYGKTRNR